MRKNKKIVIRLYLALIIFTTLFFPLFFIPMRFQFRLFWPIFSKMFLYAVKIRAFNLSEIDINKFNGVIFASSHKTFADAHILINYLRKPFTILYRRGIVNNIFVRFMYLRAGLIPIERTDHSLSVKALKKMTNKLNKKISVIMFPEGWYTNDKPVGEIKRGLSVIAKETQAQVVPVAIYGASNDFLYENNLDWQNLYFKIGEPIKYSDYNNDEMFNSELKNRIENLYFEIEKQVLSSMN